MTEFKIKFSLHLPQPQISNLKGILLVKGTEVVGSKGTFILSVSRPNRLSFVAITLNNWVAAGWVEEWSANPPLTH